MLYKCVDCAAVGLECGEDLSSGKTQVREKMS